MYFIFNKRSGRNVVIQINIEKQFINNEMYIVHNNKMYNVHIIVDKVFFNIYLYHNVSGAKTKVDDILKVITNTKWKWAGYVAHEGQQMDSKMYRMASQKWEEIKR